jgi:oxepin-CoA hydrolase/3-oxo-5,6-dehydrosuberyl-CoA semialdehyde dehydrogenase
LGDTLKSAEREVTIADIEQFAALSGDNFYAHMSERRRRAIRCSAAGSRTAIS